MYVHVHYSKSMNAYRPFEPHDEHVLRQPALPLGERGPDPEGEALLAKERVAAVARAEADDLLGVWPVRDDGLGGVARPKRARLALLQGDAHRVKALDKLTPVPLDGFQDGRTGPRHHPHADRDVGRVCNLDSVLGEWPASRSLEKHKNKLE